MLGLFKRKKPYKPLINSWSAFGKLPFHADFIRINTAHKDVQLLDEWLSKGMDWLHESEQGAQLLKDLDIGMIYQKPDQSYQLTALITSFDKGGRDYPFVVTGNTQEPLLAQYPATLPVMFASLIDHIRALPYSQSIQTKAEITPALEAIFKTPFTWSKSQLLDAQIDALSSLSQRTFVEHIEGLSNVADFSNWMLHTKALLKRYREGEAINIQLPLSIKFPLPTLSYWLQFIEGAMQPKKWPMNLIYVKTANYAYLRFNTNPFELLRLSDLCQKPEYCPPMSDTLAAVQWLAEKDCTLLQAVYEWQQIKGAA